MLVATGEEFFTQTRPLALAAEAETGGQPDYLAGRHDPPLATATDRVHISAPAPLTDDQLKLAKSITEHVFDSMERQLWRSHAIVRAGKYAGLTTDASSVTVGG